MLTEAYERFICEFDHLSKRGIIGFFDAFELIEIVRFDAGCPSSPPINVLTVVVGQTKSAPQQPGPLTPNRINLPDCKEYSFGVFRSVLSFAAFRSALVHYCQTSQWTPNEKPVSVGELQPTTKRIVPPDESSPIPLNSILKNNFFTGSYVLELFDVKKIKLEKLYMTPASLQQLSEAVAEVVPIALASLADRLGNLVIQMPIDVIRTEFKIDHSRYVAEVAWHPDAEARPLIATAQSEHDKTVITYGQENLKEGKVVLADDPGHGFLQVSIWDTVNKLLLASTVEMSFPRALRVRLSIEEPEPRSIPENIEDSEAGLQIMLSRRSSVSQVGNDPDSSPTKAIGERLYSNEQAQLAKQKKFVQYAASRVSDKSERSDALTDLRTLISSHGIHGVWLWDPYLAPQDLLDTLFHCPTHGAPMRAITYLKVPKTTCKRTSQKPTLRSEYETTLSGLPGNFRGLDIEFRSAVGKRGWAFHDRFLIFPASKGAPTKAWSLGTSVNAVGTSHHILQQVDNAQLVADAFKTLWLAIDHDDDLIWKCLS